MISGSSVMPRIFGTGTLVPWSEDRMRCSRTTSCRGTPTTCRVEVCAVPTVLRPHPSRSRSGSIGPLPILSKVSGVVAPTPSSAIHAETASSFKPTAVTAPMLAVEVPIGWPYRHVCYSSVRSSGLDTAFKILADFPIRGILMVERQLHTTHRDCAAYSRGAPGMSRNRGERRWSTTSIIRSNSSNRTAHGCAVPNSTA